MGSPQPTTCNRQSKLCQKVTKQSLIRLFHGNTQNSSLAEAAAIIAGCLLIIIIKQLLTVWPVGESLQIVPLEELMLDFGMRFG